MEKRRNQKILKTDKKFRGLEIGQEKVR